MILAAVDVIQRESPGEQLSLENYNVLKNTVHFYRPYHLHEWMTPGDGFIAEADSRSTPHTCPCLYRDLTSGSTFRNSWQDPPRTGLHEPFIGKLTVGHKHRKSCKWNAQTASTFCLLVIHKLITLLIYKFVW